MYCTLNGALVPLATATIPVSDRGFLYGETLFETMRAANGAVPLWGAHMARLRATADKLGFAVPYVDDELQAQCAGVLAANDLRAALLRLTLTRGQARRGTHPGDAAAPSVLVTAQALPPDFARKAVDGYRIATSAWERPSHRAWPLYAKTGNYLNSVLAFQSIGEQCDEAILFDDEGFLTEGSFSNIFMVREQTLWTPALPRCLPGVGRQLVIACAREAGISVIEKDITRAELDRADELFLTNAARGIMPVRAFDGAALPLPGATTAALAARWAARTGWSEWPHTAESCL
jgi:branched-chain amino acid aminotransferase